MYSVRSILELVFSTFRIIFRQLRVPLCLCSSFLIIWGVVDGFLKHEEDQEENKPIPTPLPLPAIPLALSDGGGSPVYSTNLGMGAPWPHSFQKYTRPPRGGNRPGATFGPQTLAEHVQPFIYVASNTIAPKGTRLPLRPTLLLWQHAELW